MATSPMFTCRRLAIAGAAVLGLLGGAPVVAQLPTYGLGRVPTAEEIKAWDLTIPPDGQGLPPGSGTATLGKTVFVERCASCHGNTGEDPKYLESFRTQLNPPEGGWAEGW